MGAFRSDILVGASLWLPPTKVCAQSVSPHWQGVLSLSRLAVAPGEPTNVASMLIGASIRELRRDARWHHLVTFADHSQGHTGTIYKATNWPYVGATKPTARWLTSDGAQVSTLSTRTTAEMLALGHVKSGSFSKTKL